MSETDLGLLPAFAWGMVLGAVFLAGLWFSVHGLRGARHPGLLMVTSFIARMLLVIGGFYMLSDGDWRRLVAALAGFILVRILTVRWLASGRQRSIASVQGER